MATDSLLNCFSMFVYGKTKIEVIGKGTALVEMNVLDLPKCSSSITILFFSIPAKQRLANGDLEA